MISSPSPEIPEILPRRFEIDLARGAALAGMLVVNLSVFSGVERVPLSRLAGADWVSALAVTALAEGKFYPVFAFLFGWGVSRRAEVGQNARRMGVLAVIGLLHAALLWEGDILLAYALIGLALPLTRRWSGRAVMAAGAALALLSTAAAAPGPIHDVLSSYAHWLPLVPAGDEITARLGRYALKWAHANAWLGNFAAPALLGYAVGLGKIRFGRKLSLSALGAGLLLAGLGAAAELRPSLFPADWVGAVKALAGGPGGMLLGGAYAAGVYAMGRRWPGRAWLAPVAKLGRMPLTAYLAQSAVLAALFPWEGFRPAWILPLALVIFAIQAALAWAWLGRFHQGPAEWAWRAISRG